MTVIRARHFIERCCQCNDVTRQCRCPGDKREIKTSSPCRKCGEKTSPSKRKVLDYGHVELIDVMGGDLYIVNAARQSFGQRSTTMDKKNQGLINFLMRERHGTPFEMVEFMFNVKCPIFVAREWFRHRIGSFNEYSGRYSEMLTDTYLPEVGNVRSQTGKPGAYTFEPLEKHVAEKCQETMCRAYEQAFAAYHKLMDAGVAKELARAVLPVGGYTTFTWKLNLRSLLNFISLRSDETAMWEIRQYSQTIEEMIKPHVPVAYEAFVKNGRVTP